MKTELSDNPVVPSKRGRPGYDYTPLIAGKTVIITGRSDKKVREKINNIASGARKLGLSVTTSLRFDGGQFVGQVGK